MNLKKVLLIGFLVTFVVSFPIHFMYGWFPNVLSSIFFPVNESIWEHMKIMYTSCLIGGVVECLLCKKYGIVINNRILAITFGCIFSVILYLAIYLPIHDLIGEVLWVSILLMAIVYGLVEVIRKVIYEKCSLGMFSTTSGWLIILGYLVFINWTYHPIYNELFFDKLNGQYGINEFICHD